MKKYLGLTACANRNDASVFQFSAMAAKKLSSTALKGSPKLIFNLKLLLMGLPAMQVRNKFTTIQLDLKWFYRIRNPALES